MPILCILSSSNICCKRRTVFNLDKKTVMYKQSKARFGLFRIGDSNTQPVGENVSVYFFLSLQISPVMNRRPAQDVSRLWSNFSWDRLKASRDCHPIKYNTKMPWRKPNWTWLNLVSKDKMSKCVPVNSLLFFFCKNPWSVMREIWRSENGSCWDEKNCRRFVKLYRTCSRSW